MNRGLRHNYPNINVLRTRHALIELEINICHRIKTMIKIFKTSVKNIFFNKRLSRHMVSKL